MTREEVIEQAKLVGWDAVACADPGFIAIRAYKPDTDESMRLGSGGELYTRGDDGWMYQVGTVEDVANAIRARSNP